jgi:DNA-binding MarR family transcriptional regulator
MKAKLDEIIHQPVRLRLMATLTALPVKDSVDFVYLRDFLGLSDGNLGAHLKRLEDAGYISIEKTFENRKPRSYAAATAKGRETYKAHLAALEEIIAAPESPRKGR